MFLGHFSDKLFDECLARLKQVVERDGFLRHPFKAARELLRDVQSGGREDLRHRAVMAEDVNDEGFPQASINPLVRQKVADVEQVAGMLPVERRDQLAGIKVGEADHLDFGEAELRFDGPRYRQGFGFIYAAAQDRRHLDLDLDAVCFQSQRRCSRGRSPGPPPAGR